ncbi:TRM11 family methyltransferase [Streptomyces sp. 7-21]|jgi:SAM-dependent methyltransferase|uniref:TRM11 family SAM-dependent methyltransferase n=1 Tax=Streptomyces sp. 7-21 TaxID=2802283 RepID=UPI00191EF868|nr:SAM-dependent methyltransferase [Streptomyces sp. 7-21]MBL1068336.1 SAM-dependent methyltransferase [Streptomyces sp. 7-21]
MNTYGFLLLPSHNRVYARAATALARAELLAFNETVLGGRLRDVSERVLGGAEYVTFRAEELSARDIGFLANLSALYALFRLEDDGTRLVPLPAERLDRFPSDLVSTQRYVGKTNEDFTKLLLNVTAVAADRPERLLTGGLRVLDPLCGRGTTLNQALMYGLHAAGVDRDGRSFEAYENFLRHWLRASRIKHQAQTATVRRDRRALGRRFHVTLAEDKERYKKGEHLEVTMVHADTTASGDFFRPASFDLIVTDAPYGVQHGARSRGAESRPATSRSPLPLLRSALPVWTRLLRRGGAVGLSWNTRVARREELAELFAGHGLVPVDAEPYQHFAHRVDQSIVRDLIVARKPTGAQAAPRAKGAPTAPGR